jgi:hypothetical protein
MLKRAIHAAVALSLAAALSGCEKAEQSAKAPSDEKNAVSVLPEHFDRVRAEQFEREEDSLSLRGRTN